MNARLLLALSLAVAACKKSPAETPPPPEAAKPAEGKPAEAKPAAPVIPSAVSTLSVFEPVGAACEWRAVEPVAKTSSVIASLPGSCLGARVTWSPDASKAVVWFDSGHVQSAGYFSQSASKAGWPDETVDETAKPRAFSVDVRAGTAEPLPVPTLQGEDVAEYGVDAKGAVLALTEQRLADDVVEKGSVTVDGKTFDLSQFSEGLPELAHAYRFENGVWKRVETKATTTGWDYGMGVKELEASRSFGARSEDLSSAHAQGDVVEGDALTALKPLTPPKAGEGAGEWIFLGAGGTRFYAWEVSGEFAYTTGLVAAGAPPKPLPGLGFTDGDLVAIRTSGPFVLVAASSVGTHPRLYQLPEAKLAWQSDTARAVTFWPTTAKPERHEAP